jgi:hypothetical protein
MLNGLNQVKGFEQSLNGVNDVKVKNNFHTRECLNFLMNEDTRMQE